MATLAPVKAERLRTVAAEACCLSRCHVAELCDLRAARFYGPRGVAPVAALLRRIKQDTCSVVWGFLLHPSLFWVLGGGQAAIRGVAWVGAAGGAGVAFLSGAAAFWSALAAYVAFVSLIHCDASAINYPWWCLYAESAFLALWMPFAGGDAAVPAWPVRWAFTWLLFRLMKGFGNLKFAEGWRKHWYYLRSFFLIHPSPNPLAFLAFKYTPAFVFPVALAGLYFAEVIAPFFFFCPAPFPWIGAVVTIGLMASIQATGNFGHFNLLTALLAVHLFAPEPEVEPAVSLSQWVLAVVVVFLGLINYKFNSLLDVCNVVTIVGGIEFPRSNPKSPLWARTLYTIVFTLFNLRVSHPYGVFRSFTAAPVTTRVVFEGSNDGRTWQEYRYRHRLANLGALPPDSGEGIGLFVTAPLQPLLDYNLFYDSVGLFASSPTRRFANKFPFSQTTCWYQRIRECLLDKDSDVSKLFVINPFPNGPPSMVRVRLEMYDYTPGHVEVSHVATLEEGRGPGDAMAKYMQAQGVGPYPSSLYRLFMAHGADVPPTPSDVDLGRFWEWVAGLPQAPVAPEDVLAAGAALPPADTDRLQACLLHVVHSQYAACGAALAKEANHLDVAVVLHCCIMRCRSADAYARLSAADFVATYTEMMPPSCGPTRVSEALEVSTVPPAVLWVRALQAELCFAHVEARRSTDARYSYLKEPNNPMAAVSVFARQSLVLEAWAQRCRTPGGPLAPQCPSFVHQGKGVWTHDE